MLTSASASGPAEITALAVDILIRVDQRWRSDAAIEGIRAWESRRYKQNLKAKVNKMERSSKRGKIPQRDWPLIIKRYEAGETLATIARTYDCSPPAISYILSRSRARNASGDVAEHQASEAAEAGLVKRASNPPLPEGIAEQASAAEIAPQIVKAQNSTPLEASSSSLLSDRAAELDCGQTVPLQLATNGPADGAHEAPRDIEPPENAGALPTALPQSAEPRRTLHLPLSSGGGQHPDSQHHQMRGSDVPQQRPLPAEPRQNSVQHFAPNNGQGLQGAAEAQQGNGGGAFIDQMLRERVDDDIASFLAAFDAALAHDSIESRARLREATDRLLRAGARTRIELERLEARVPLPARDNGKSAAPSWRSR